MDGPSGSWHLVPDLDAGDLLERFLVSAVFAILAIRAYLAATGYPQVGGNGLHVAHMLWGGLLMLVAVVLLLAFLGGRAKHAAAILGGLGFGTFVDELGKFITSDNNYFFQPTVAILYAIFVVLFLAFRTIARPRDLSASGYLANALDATREVVLRGADEDGGARTRALALLARCDPRDPLVAAVRSVLHEGLPPPRARAEGRTGLVHIARRAYEAFVRSRWVRRAVVAIFLLHALGAVVSAIVIVVSDPGFAVRRPNVSFAEAGAGLSSFLAGFFAVIGAISLRTSTLAAYQWFRRSTLVSIFLAQVFAFYREEFVALTSLAVAVVYLAALNYAIRQSARPLPVPAGEDRRPRPATAPA